MRTRLYVTDLGSSLYTIDPATGSAGLVGPTGLANVTDIAFHGPTLYGISFAQLLRLNPDTGAATVVGPTGFTTNGLAVAEDGTIFAGTNPGQLIRINPVTGAGTLVGPFGGGLTSAGDLVFDANGVLYAALNAGGGVSLARINPATGAATVIGPSGFIDLWGLAITCCRFFGVTAGGKLLSINAATGAATVIGGNSVQMGGATARQCCC